MTNEPEGYLAIAAAMEFNAFEKGFAGFIDRGEYLSGAIQQLC